MNPFDPRPPRTRPRAPGPQDAYINGGFCMIAKGVIVRNLLVLMRRSSAKREGVDLGDMDKKTADHKTRTQIQEQQKEGESSEEMSFHENKSNAEEKLLNTTEGPTKNGREVHLKCTLSLVQGVALIAGVMIGSGIFVSPRFVLENSGSVGLMVIVWFLSGVVAMLGALCYCELGTFIQKSGGELVYIQEAFGHLPSFLVSWTIILIMKPASVAIITLSFAYYACQPFLSETQENPTMYIKAVGIGCIVVITTINCLSTRWAARLQVLFMAMKLLAIGIIVVLGIAKLIGGETEGLENPFKGTQTNIGVVARAFFSGLWAYDGWNQLNYVTDELQNPHKNLPRAVMLALPLVTLCYVLVNVAYLSILGPAEVLASHAVAVTVAEKVHPVLVIIMPLLVACSCYGAANGSVFTCGRLVSAAAKEGHMPKFLSTISRFQTPSLAIMFPPSISIIMLLVGDLEVLLSCFSFVAWTFYGGTVAALLVLRWKRPNQHRPYKVRLVIPIIMLLVAFYLVTAPFFSKPLESLIALAYILAGIPVYFFFVAKKQKAML